MIRVLIKRILVITETGLPLFDHSESARTDSALVSGLISAILKFAEETEKETISRVMFQESQYILKTIQSIIFIFQFSDQISDEYSEYIINVISNDFASRYKDEIDNFTGYISAFSKFHEICEGILLQCGVPIIDNLYKKLDEGTIKAFCIFDLEPKALTLNAADPHYNIDSFTIFTILAKSFKRVLNGVISENKGSSYHLTHDGNLVQTIVLPRSIIVIEAQENSLKVDQFRRFKIKTEEELASLFFEILSNEHFILYGRDFPGKEKEDFPSLHLTFNDLFTAAEKGMSFLFNCDLLLQLISCDKKKYMLFKLPARTVFLEFNATVKDFDILKSLQTLLSVQN